MFRLKNISIGFIVVVAISQFISALRPLNGQDIWFQMMAGQYALKNSAVPHIDFFSYMGAGSNQLFGGWGFGALYEWMIQHGGWASASYLNSSLWTLSFVFAIMAALARSGMKSSEMPINRMVGVALVIAVLSVCLAPRMAMRAESTLVLAWMSGTWLFEWSKARGKWVFFLAGLPLIAWLEAMMHTGGFVLWFLWVICAARSGVGRGPWRGWLPWVASLAALLFLPMANPNGARQVLIQAESIWRVVSMEGGPSDALSNLEYLPIWAPEMLGMASRFFGVYALSLSVFGRARAKGVWVENAILALFLTMGALHNRAIGLAAMAIAVPALEAALAGGLIPWNYIEKGLGRWFGKVPRRGKKSMALALAGALLAAPVAEGVSNGSVGVQGGETGYEKIVDIIRKSAPEGARIFTSEEGYELAYLLGYERYKVSPVSHDLIENEAALNHVKMLMRLKGPWRAELDKIDFVCLPLYRPLVQNGYVYELPKELVSSPRWRYHPQGGWPCDLFEKLKAGEPDLGLAERLDQGIEMLSYLAMIADKSARLLGDRHGQQIVNVVMPQLDGLKAARAALEKSQVQKKN